MVVKVKLLKDRLVAKVGYAFENQTKALLAPEHFRVADLDIKTV